MNRGLLLAVVAGCVGAFAAASSAGLAKLSGGSGYSADLAKNLAIRHQQLICDPTEAPVFGSLSVDYNPCVVGLSGLDFGPGYTGQGFVEEEAFVKNKAVYFLQNINSFLVAPEGTQTGYAQVSFTQTGTPGTISPQQGFTPIASNGVSGFDTNSLMFTYLPDVADSTVAQYTVFADTGKRPSGNKPDSLTGVGPSGAKFTVGPSQLSSATVAGNLVLSTGVTPVMTPVMPPDVVTVEKGKLEVVAHTKNGQPDYSIVFDVHLSSLCGFDGRQFSFNYSESTTKAGSKEYELFKGNRVGNSITDFKLEVPITVPYKQYNPSQPVTLTISNVTLGGKPVVPSQVVVQDKSNSGP